MENEGLNFLSYTKEVETGGYSTGGPRYSPTSFTTHFSLLAHATKFLLTVGNDTQSKEA